MRRLRVLGPLEVDGAEQVLGPRDRVVVSALALHPGERVDAEALAEALWGEELPASAAKVVQGCVSRLRKALGADTVETVAGGYRMRSGELDIDRERFEELVDKAREHLATRAPERAIPLLTQALALWRGPAFGDLEDWMPGRLEAVRLGQLRLAAEEDLLQARLDAGDHAAVAADGTVLTGQQPFRERRWAILALAQYRSGRQADALASIRSARRALGQELGLDPGSELVLLESRILAQDPGLAIDHAARIADESCPWKGLASYGAHDGGTFFGRDADIAACLARLREFPLLVVTGPSGCGKSSLAQAGLVPALRAEGTEVEVFTPGSDGPMAMAEARSRRARPPLLVIDQFEEAFTLSSASLVRPWLGELAAYAQEAPVVLVVRGDFVAELGADDELARMAERGLHIVAPLAGDRLREAIEGPARVAGLRVEPGLVDLVVRDADGQPGALPLMSHALTETWHRREEGLLTVDGYRAAGGIRDAVAASAERLYEGLNLDERTQLRWLMLRMVSLSDGNEPFRTPLPGSLVSALDPVRRRLLDLLVRGRLVTSRDGGYDLAHEALVRAWPRLQTWLDEDRAGQQVRRHLSMAASGWDALDRADTELYRGARLAATLEWLERGHEPLPDIERDFIEASQAVADDVVRRLAEEARQQLRQNRRLRWLVVATTVLLVAAVVAGVMALERGQAARRGEESARAAASVAEHQALLRRSLDLREHDRGLAALLAVQAWNEEPGGEDEQSALTGVLDHEPGFLGYGYLWLEGVAAAAGVADDTRVLFAVGSSVSLVDPSTREATPSFRRPDAFNETLSVLRVSADGTRAVNMISSGLYGCPQGWTCRTLVVYDLATRSFVVPPVRVPFVATDLAVNHDGSLAIVTGGSHGEVITWDLGRGRAIARAELGSSTVTFGAGGVAYLGGSGVGIREVDARTLEVRRVLPLPRAFSDHALAVSDDLLMSAGSSGQAAFDLAEGRRLWPVGRAREEASHGCESLAVSVVLSRSYCGLVSGVIEERDIRSGDLTGRRFDPQFRLGSDLIVNTAPDGEQVLLAPSAESNLYARWRLKGRGLDARPVARGTAAVAAACTLAGRNPTYDEWFAYFSRTAPIKELCPSLPTAEDQRIKG